MKIKYTEREKIIIDLFSTELKNVRKKLKEAKELLDINERYLKYKPVKKLWKINQNI